MSTQPYYRSDIGTFKAKILANNLYRAIGTEVATETKKLTAANIHQLTTGSQLIIDAFDNSIARQAVTDYAATTGITCLHIGLSAEYSEVIWNEQYRVPSDANDDIWIIHWRAT